VLLNGQACAGQADCPRGYSLRQSAGGALALSPEAPDLRFVGASPDLRHVILSTCRALTPDATEAVEEGGCNPTLRNLYEWDGSQLALVNRQPGHRWAVRFLQGLVAARRLRPLAMRRRAGARARLA
jgi:hypothetical protein